MASRVFDIIFRARGAEKAKSDADNLEKSFDQLAQKAKAAAVGFVSVQTAMKAFEMAKLAATAESVRRSFSNLALEPDKMLQAMKKATAGTISEMELMQRFNEASLLGLPLDRFDEMLEIARGAAQSTGQSMDFMLNSIVVALGRGSKLMLDNLGIMIDVKKANEDYAEALGTTADKLTDQEKKQAFVNTALEIGNENLQRSGGVIDSNIDSFGRFDASLQNLSESFGKTLVPSISNSLDFLSDLADNVSTFFVTVDKGINFLDNFSKGVSQTAKEYFGLTDEIKQATQELDKFQQLQVFGERIKELKAQQALIDASIEEQQRGIVASQGFFAALFGELTGANEAARTLIGVSGEVQKAGLEIFIKSLTEEIEQYGLTLDDVNKTKLTPYVETKMNYLKVVKMLNQENSTELAFQDSLKGSYAEFIEQQMVQLENQEKQQKFTEFFIASYPEEAEALGMLKDKTDEHSKAMNQQIQMANLLSGALQTTFDPDLGAGEAFKGFIIQLMSAMQGVILASKAVSEALTFTFTGPLGIGTALASLAALEAAKAKVRSIKFAQYGIDEMVSQPTLIVAGEAGPERVNITPATRPSSEQSSGGLTINFNGPVTNREFVRDTIIPEIDRVKKLGLA